MQTRSFALLLLGFFSNSVSDASTGFLVTSSALGVLPQTHTGKSGGQVQPWHQEAILRFTKRSSRE